MSTDRRKPNWEPKIIVLMCDWCLFSELDRADLARVQAQPNVRIVKIPCLGRMDPMYVLTALQEGIDGVLVAGCHLGDCHYKRGNFMAENRIAVLQTVLETSSLKGRTKFAHISTAERGVFPRLVEEMQQKIGALGPIEEELT